MKNKEFKFNNLVLEYLELFIDSERRIELPLLKFFIDIFKSNVIEIGAVSNHHFKISHIIYDATEYGVINELAENIDYTGKNVVSISTIEHIGRNEYGLKSPPFRCITTLNKMLESDNYLITFPIGYNTLLDYYIRHIVVNIIGNTYTAHRIDNDNNWEIDNHINFDYKYNYPFKWGNGLCIISNLKEFKMFI